MKGKIKQANQGITLVALVVTIVVLLILAGITLTYVLGDNSVFKQATQAKEETAIAKAREKLEIVLTSAQIPKKLDKEYNENEYLDAYILEKIKDAEIVEDIAIVDGYAFELDRSVPRIGKYVGTKDKLNFPKVEINKIVLADDKTSTSIEFSAIEETNGIYKIEIIQKGNVIEEYTYDNRKDKITEIYTAKQNGQYIIKAYSNLSAKKEAQINGIAMAIEYIPNGNQEYKKEHQVKVVMAENTTQLKSIKYQWNNTTKEPTKESFTQTCENNATITAKGYTGTYYLWTLVELQNGNTRILRSEGFNFDNEKPAVTLSSTPLSESSFRLTAEATDEHSGIVRYEFHIGDKKEIKESSNNSVSIDVTEMATGETNCYVKVYDYCNNSEESSEIKASTKLYTWGKYELLPPYTVNVSQTTTINNQEIMKSSYYTKWVSLVGSKMPTLKADENGEIDLSTGYRSIGSSIAKGDWYWDGNLRHVVTDVNWSASTTWGVAKVETYKCTVVPSSNLKGTYIETVKATSRNEYPDAGAKDGYYYEWKGIE